MKKLISLLMIVCLGAVGPFPVLAQEESIFQDINTGNYIVTYRGFPPENEIYRVVFVPATKIDPVVKSKFKLTAQENVRYQYRVKSGQNSKQPLVGLRLLASNAIETSQIIPKGWRGNLVPNIVDPRLRVNWSYADLKEDVSAGLLPGQSQDGFSIDSPELPEVGMARLNGAAPILALPDEGPDPDGEVGRRLNELTANDFVTLPVAVPKIAVPAPFDAAAVLNSLNKHIKEDLVAMKLADPVFADQLGRLLDSAADAASRNDAETVRGFIKDLRRLLKREHEDVEEEEDWDNDDEGESDGGKASPLIDKLAARVLDFDLKYIDERLKKQDDD